MPEPRTLSEDAPRRLWLPPEEVRLWNPETQGTIDTPLDGRGLVDLNKLVLLGKQTVEEDYDWSSPLNDIHHLQWPAAFYKEYDNPVAVEFRELVQRKAYPYRGYPRSKTATATRTGV